jgi:hypothetical protein
VDGIATPPLSRTVDGAVAVEASDAAAGTATGMTLM